MTNCHNNSDIGIWAFGPNSLTKAYGTKADDYANGRNLSALQPYVYFDGTIKIEFNEETMEKDKKDMAIVGYGNYTIGNDDIGMVLDIGNKAEIYVNHGHGLYCSNENSRININGGKIVGSNGITIRGGQLNISRVGNPTVVGTADFNEYVPTHPSGQAGNGLFVGNAVLVEACNFPNVGYGQVSAIVESGTFVSNNNTSIGSYSNSMTGEFPRIVKFISGGLLNRVPTLIPYDPSTGHYSDYDVVADGYITSTPTMIIKNPTYES